MTQSYQKHYISTNEKLIPFYTEDIELLTNQNHDYRRVIYDGFNQQLVLMSIEPYDDIELETHETHDQFIRIEQGEGKAIIDNKEYYLKDNTALIIPAKSSHQIINTSPTMTLKLYTIYSPSPFEHEPNLIQHTNPNRKSKKKFNVNTYNIHAKDAYDKYVMNKNNYIELVNNDK